MESTGRRDLAAKAVGISDRTVRNYCKANPGFAEELAVLARQHAVTAHHAPRMLSKAGAAGELLGDGPGEVDASALNEVGRAAFMELLSRHANDGDSRGCSKALDILAQLHFARDLLAIKAEAKRAEAEQDAGDTRPVVLIKPALPAADGVIEAEILDDRSGHPRGGQV